MEGFLFILFGFHGQIPFHSVKINGGTFIYSLWIWWRDSYPFFIKLTEGFLCILYRITRNSISMRYMKPFLSILCENDGGTLLPILWKINRIPSTSVSYREQTKIPPSVSWEQYAGIPPSILLKMKRNPFFNVWRKDSCWPSKNLTQAFF